MSQHVLIYGGSGSLGSVIVKHFKAHKWAVISIDFRKADADHDILLSASESWLEQQQKIMTDLKPILNDKKLSAIICVAGGWAGGNASDESCSFKLMWKQSVHSSVIAGNVATNYLSKGGLLCLTGAKAAMHGTPGMIGYGMAKAAVLQLTKSLAATGSGLPADSKVMCIMPITLDTPANRAGMPKADTSNWTPLGTLADKLFEWAATPSALISGTLVEVATKNGETTYSAL